VFNVLLQILDDGRLTDAQGRTVDFRNVVIIMTSNIGSQHILESAAGGDWEQIDRDVRAQLHRHFRPEFLNRVDDVVVFRPLGEDELRRIVDLQLERVQALAGQLGIILEVTDEAKRHLAMEGYDPVFGARPLKRAIQRSIQDPLALFLLDEEVAEGTVIRVDVDEAGERLAFEALAPSRLATVSAPAGEPGA
jgi:ATP-dependent Clp protease ATP-binding subunit ClpB